MSLDPATKENLNMWLENDIDHQTKEEIKHLLEENPLEIVNAFYTRLSFGTGGLRGVMGIGTNRMNRYTVRLTTQGLANYLNKQPPKNQRHAVLIGYDSRHHSPSFAEEAARVLAANGIQVYLFSELRPTPLVSFGCRLKECSAAIMITASHNPPEYNGYKVYWSDGGQVVPPHDEGIINEVKTITSLSEVKISKDALPHLIEKIDKEIDYAYIRTITHYQLYPEENREYGSDISIVYSSLHGTGITLIPQALYEWGFHNFQLVDEQCNPDGDFPTVKAPNPEVPEALQMGIEKMIKEKADLFIATDPDADRVGVVVNHNGQAIQFNGNQMACLCLYHICRASIMPKNAGFIKTIATTELFRVIAESFGGSCFDVLTGFKYVAEKMTEWENTTDGYQFIFGGEESYGYLLGTHSHDKDAIVSSALICEVALHAKLNGQTLVDLMEEIYHQYGYYHEKLTAITFEENKLGRDQMKEKIEALFKSPPKSILDIPVKTIEDYRQSLKTTLETEKQEPLLLPKTNALMLWLEDETKILIRPSGTEPKIKVYCGVVKKSFTDLEKTKKDSEQQAQAILSAFNELL